MEKTGFKINFFNIFTLIHLQLKPLDRWFFWIQSFAANLNQYHLLLFLELGFSLDESLIIF